MTEENHLDKKMKTEVFSHRKAPSVLFVLLCILFAAGIACLSLINANRLTWMENETWQQEELSKATEGSVCTLPLSSRMEIIHTVWVVCERRAEMFPDTLTLQDSDGNTVGELVRLSCEKKEKKDWWQYRLSDRTRLKQKKGGSYCRRPQS